MYKVTAGKQFGNKETRVLEEVWDKGTVRVGDHRPNSRHR